jgi:hypothetical protein
MSSDSAEVRAMLSALVSKVENCKELFSAQAVGNALYGMQRMSSDNNAVRDMLFALIPKIEGCKEVCSVIFIYCSM